MGLVDLELSSCTIVSVSEHPTILIPHPQEIKQKNIYKFSLNLWEQNYQAIFPARPIFPNTFLLLFKNIDQYKLLIWKPGYGICMSLDLRVYIGQWTVCYKQMLYFMLIW